MNDVELVLRHMLMFRLFVCFFVMKPKSDAPLTTPRIDDVLTQFRQRGGKPSTENQENEQRIKKLEQQVSHLIQKVFFCFQIS